MRFTQQQIIHSFLYGLSAFGIWIIWTMLEVNAIRGDEFLSYLHSDPRWTYSEVIQHIRGGADNSYLHAVILRWAFGAFGHSIVVQRLISLAAWMVGSLLLYGVIKRENNKAFNSFLLVATGFSNFGFFLATDGRFYSLLFCLASASLYVYINRKRWYPIFSIGLFAIIQLLGLLTSANFVVFQLLFVGAMIGMFLFDRNREAFILIAKWGGCIVLTAVVYFSFFKIPYFHSYFLTGFFTDVPFCISDIVIFAGIPFRWVMLPHLPYCSDMVDGFLFIMMLIAITGYYRKGIVAGIKSASVGSRFIGLMAVCLLLGLCVQLLLYNLKGFPLWESRYYAAVFFVVPIAALLLVREVLTINILLVCCCLWMARLVAVEYPKIEQRREALKVIEQTQSEIRSQPKPALFAEQVKNNQSSMFVLMGNIYIRYPETRTKLYLMTDSSLMDRTLYFQRLSSWHYPLGLVFAADSSAFYNVPSKK